MTQTEQDCPRCGGRLVRLGPNEPWCANCAWNLDAYPTRPHERVTRRKRREHARAFRVDRDMYEQLRSAPPGRPTASGTRLTLMVIAAALYVLNIAFVVGGVWLVIYGFFVWKLLGVLLVLVGAELRPRLPKATDDPLGSVTRIECPQLFALLDEVVAALDGPSIDEVILTPDFNAACRRVGLRRRPEVTIGLPLWSALTPQAKIALLGHEVGHLVNGDPERGVVLQPVLTTFGSLARLTRPDRLVMNTPGGPLASWIASIIAHVVFRPLGWLAVRIQLWLYTLAAGDHQRAEYYADALAADLAGTDGARALMRTLVFRDAVIGSVRRRALDSADPDEWRTEVDDTLRTLTDAESAREQLSTRVDASPYSTHPPIGYRARLLREWPTSTGRLTLTDERSAAIDRELDNHWARTRKTLNQTPAG